MTYEAWRISYQSSEQAARAAYEECAQLRAKIEAMERQRPVRFVFKSDELDEQIKLATDSAWAETFEVPEGMVALYALPGAQPAPLLGFSDVSLMDEGKTEGTPSIPEGWRKELFCIQHAMAMNNWNWESDASNNMKRAAYAAVARMLAAASEPKP